MRYRRTAQPRYLCTNIERLEQRQLLAADLADHDHDHQWHNWWSPASRAIDLPAISGPAFSAKTDWQNVLTTHVDDLVSDHETPTYRITHSNYDEDLKATLVYLQQTADGIDIVNAHANFAIADNGQVRGFTSFVDTKLKVDQKLQFASVSPEFALNSLAKEYEWTVSSLVSAPRTESIIGGKQYAALDVPGLAREPVAFESIYVPVADGSLVPGWRLNVQPLASDSWLDASVSALDGQVLHVVDWTSDAQYQVFALPKESPSDGGRTTLVNPHNTSQSPFGWHDTNGNTGAESLLTTGNNTNAYTDVDSNNVPDVGSSPSGGSALSFTPALDFTQTPAVNAPASTVNLFYVTNVLHDVFGNKGFNAASGNFQVNNYGAGGLGNDPLNAEDIDGGGTNNANMSTPPDGSSPRMQMYRWTVPTPGHSGSFDNGVIAHEFGHGVTNRLTGGPANSGALSGLQSGGMGEGWSDYFALAFTQVAGDTANDGRGIGTYALGQPSDGPGIRTQRYSYDMAVNSHVFTDIVGSTSVHFIGETWAATLWDLHWALIGGNTLDPNLPDPGLGFNANLNGTTGGNNVALRLIVQALKLQPVSPTFLDARDAILAADELLYDGAHLGTLWNAFARRGMGSNATSGASTSTLVTAGYDVPLINRIDFQREGLLGSTISSIDENMLPISSVGGERRVSFTAETGTKTSFVITPENSAATLTVRILRDTGSSARGPASSPTPGAPVVITPWSLSSGGEFILVVSSNQPTGVRVQAARNAALESQIGDSNFDNELNINFTSSLLPVGSTNGAVGKSDAGVQFTKLNDPTKFVDISATGTALNLSDDSEATIVTTIGNLLLPAGNVRVGNNGGVLASSVGDVDITNTAISSLPAAPLALFPFWDDIDSDTGNVYWQELPVEGIPTLIVQWHNRPRFSNVGSATFQLQVRSTGPALARFAYLDVDFGNVAYNNGASATIGAVTPTASAQFSFNAASVFNGDYIDISALEDIDEYRFSGVAGQRVDVAMDALGVSSVGASFMRLLTETNAVLATATTKPLSTSTTVSNYDLGLVDFVLPATGNYSVRLYGRASFNYYLSVTEALALDTENSSGNITPNHMLTLPGAMIGYVDPMDSRDLDDIMLTAGQSIRATLTLVGTGANVAPENNLAPRLAIIRPSGSSAIATTTFNSSGEMILNYTAVSSGRHRIDVRSVTGAGEYHVKIEAISPALLGAPLVEPPKLSEPQFAIWQNQIDPLDVSGDARVTPLDALLLIDELNSRRLSSADGRLPEAWLSAERVDAMFDANGDGLVTPSDALIVIDRLNRMT